MNRDKPAHLTAQSEERQHHVWTGALDYQIGFKNEQTSIDFLCRFSVYQ